ncbi:MAG: hypothetical protein CMP22_01830 [Rickettsiales bacterium]|nr:hypothetical protein [Rickettsiales bacterium]|tara:strand:+ start:867 stop:1088 length:222 start_codon:yes stop_codon:yes gene_type:complete
MDLIAELQLDAIDESLTELEARVSKLKKQTGGNVQQLTFELDKANEKQAKVTKILDNTIETVESLLTKKRETA